ncbi:MAG TPA: extracellular solute-binding protein [Actinophytocola sp.]|jgi:multiple sugar transport system substrate-binding protein|uniref:extracellular solute-binding protein n=1 Tax=Actinophytocola sp. TaxID=1872138 RepID=UPI002DFAE4E0|nr:extracellular solute-binding protein [Actinophytocola sp.]
MTSLSRRRFMVSALALGATSCAGSDLYTGAATKLRYWNLFGGGDGVNMLAMLDAFRAANPDVEVEASTLAWGPPYYTKLAMASTGGRAPDVAILHLSRLPAFAPAGLLDPVDLDLLAEAGVRPEDFPQSIWEQGQHGGRTYAVPLDTHPLVMYYNVDVCAKAGLLDAAGKLKPITGPDQIIEAFLAAKRVTGAHGMSVETFGPGAVSPWRLFWTMYRQLGGELRLDGPKLAIDDGKALQALEFMRRLSTSGAAVTEVDYQGSVALFAAGKAGFHWNGEWEVSSFLTAKTPFSMTRFPSVFNGSAVVEADAHTLVLPHRRDRGGAAERAAYRFIAFLLKNSVTWAKGGHIPAYRPVAESQEYLALEPQSAYRSVADEVQLDPPAWFSGSGSVLETETGAAFSTVLTGRGSARDGLDQAKSALQKLLDTPSPV